ncbi:Uncharacterized protein conserved in bacteria [Klebsiella pneumoniae]|uniref:Uncharacterized protein conserved in bacteria n=1 Tax=Klebsiella pneumoniae TaxID=573 RepID=A0A447RTG2_KLEPN|nr:Uncharacterized protein conserved in bacteria [Klebsiella pneumoniae]
MKPIGEEQQEVASALNDRAVVDYLLQHPEFFIRNAALVEHLRVPHPVRGTISLVEWHMMRARNPYSCAGRKYVAADGAGGR